MYACIIEGHVCTDVAHGYMHSTDDINFTAKKIVSVAHTKIVCSGTYTHAHTHKNTHRPVHTRTHARMHTHT
jgi:hypothetical protein